MRRPVTNRYVCPQHGQLDGHVVGTHCHVRPRPHNVVQTGFGTGVTVSANDACLEFDRLCCNRCCRVIDDEELEFRMDGTGGGWKEEMRICLVG